MNQAAFDFLDDEVFYADMLDSIRRDSCEILRAGPCGVLLKTDTGTVMMASADADAASSMLDLVDECGLLVVHDPFTIPLAEARLGFNRQTPCFSSAYLGLRLPVGPRPDLRVEPLTPRWAEFVATHYHMDNLEYAQERIAAGVILGAFRDEQLLGFIGRHSEGAMGMLVVLPEYRRQGVAEHLVTHLANQFIDEGRTPYDHIIRGNRASESLQRKLNFTISTRTLCWMSSRPASGLSLAVEDV